MARPASLKHPPSPPNAGGTAHLCVAPRTGGFVVPRPGLPRLEVPRPVCRVNRHCLRRLEKRADHNGPSVPPLGQKSSSDRRRCLQVLLPLLISLNDLHPEARSPVSRAGIARGLPNLPKLTTARSRTNQTGSRASSFNTSNPNSEGEFDMALAAAARNSSSSSPANWTRSRLRDALAISPKTRPNTSRTLPLALRT